jgi:L-iditol 2-dehydrogenase
VAKPWQLQPAPEGMDRDLASLGEPIACAMYSGMQSEIRLGDFVVVLGGGFAGLIIAQCAKKMGADHVMVVDTLEGKLGAATSLGADSTANAMREDVRALVKERSRGAGADVVVEAAGSEASMNLATDILRHAGKLVFYSWMTQPVTLNISRWHDDGFKLVNTCLVHHTWQERFVWVPAALRPVIQGHVRVRPLITNELPLSELAAGFELADRDESAIKIVFRP